MSWASALKKTTPTAAAAEFAAVLPDVPLHVPNRDLIVTIDFETYFDADYTLRKMSTSEYVRDSRFKVHMVGIKIGRKKTVVVPGARAARALKEIPWSLMSLLCHNTAFDGFILSHHYGIVPKFYYDTLSMARGMLKNDISAGLDDVARHFSLGNKLPDVLDSSKGVLELPKALYADMAEYCKTDVDLTPLVFDKLLAMGYPQEEIELIDQAVRMFCDPVLRVDIPRVEAEHAREVAARRDTLLSVLGGPKEVARRRLLGESIDDMLEAARKVVAGSESFANLLRAEKVDPPRKISPAWLKKPTAERDDDDPKKFAYAFAKTDLEFLRLLAHKSERVRTLVNARLAIKSTINETRAVRFLNAGANGCALPVLLNYGGAHTHRFSAGNKMNMQNLPRGGELRKAILAPKGHRVVVVDSGQIEARVNGWLWQQLDLLEGFRLQDTGADRDVYCKFADHVYGRTVIKDNDPQERQVGKIGVLGLGYQMGAPRLQDTLAIGNMGPPIFMSLDQCKKIVSTYRRLNYAIVNGWGRCGRIIGDMHAGSEGGYGPLVWDKNRIHLPNGMQLKYPQLHRKSDLEDGDEGGSQWQYMRKGEPVKIYGGMLCENIVQALARIIVAHQLIVISRSYRVVMFSHDEVVTVVKNRHADRALEHMLKVMKTPLEWCADLPLFAEGGHADNYSK